MRVWRLTLAPYADLQGLGGLYGSGRWHTQGRQVVYTASSLALASLEYLVHLGVMPGQVPDDLVRLEIHIPDQLAQTRIEERSTLPSGWEDPYAGGRVCQPLGNAWLADRNGPAVLSVPSAIIAEERNYLINPLFPDAGAIEIIGTEPFEYEARIIKMYEDQYRHNMP